MKTVWIHLVKMPSSWACGVQNLHVLVNGVQRTRFVHGGDIGKAISVRGLAPHVDRLLRALSTHGTIEILGETCD